MDERSELTERARLLRRQCQSAMTSEEADRMFAAALQSEREDAAADALRTPFTKALIAKAREDAAAEARRAAIEECEKIAGDVAEGIAGRRGYDPAALTAAEHIEANIHALASPAPQEETR